MSPQVTAALISGGAALVVALIGISGAIAAQFVATRRAFDNSLRLFEQEYGKRDRERAAEVRREDEYRFADQRRSAYAKLLRTVADLRLALLALNAAAEQWENARDPELRPDEPDVRAQFEERADRRLRDSFPRWAQLHTELEETEDEIELLGSPAVRRAAAELADIVWRNPELGNTSEFLNWPHVPLRYDVIRPSERRYHNYNDARAAFLDAARSDLGIGLVATGRSGLIAPFS